MKDRIRLIMESQHMTQHVFAQFIKISPATLSGIFNGRTNPSLNIVEAIKQNLPSISTDWLLFGRGQMYVDQERQETTGGAAVSPTTREPQLDFSSTPTISAGAQLSSTHSSGAGSQVQNTDPFVLKNIDRPQRKITEIRIFFDDQTFESFVPKK